jgi:CoA-transferase family III
LGKRTVATNNRVPVSRESGPLDGVRVIEIGSLLAGPVVGRLLGDVGADVIKVEPPGKPDPLRDWAQERYKGRTLWWPGQSRTKKCTTLDLRVERGQQLLLELVPHSDVVVENFRPGTLESWNLDYERLSDANPGNRAHARFGLWTDRPVRKQSGVRCSRRGYRSASVPERVPWPGSTAPRGLLGRFARRAVRGFWNSRGSPPARRPWRRFGTSGRCLVDGRMFRVT